MTYDLIIVKSLLWK